MQKVADTGKNTSGFTDSGQVHFLLIYVNE